MEERESNKNCSLGFRRPEPYQVLALPRGMKSSNIGAGELGWAGFCHSNN
jgi:hypothetical protein